MKVEDIRIKLDVTVPSVRTEYRTFGFQCPACDGQVSVMFPWPFGASMDFERVRLIHADGSQDPQWQQHGRCGLSLDYMVIADIIHKLQLQAEAGVRESLSELLLRRSVKTTKPRKFTKRGLK